MAKFTSLEKIQAVKRYVEGTEGYKSIAKEMGVSTSVFHTWIQLYRHQGESGFKKRYTPYSIEDKLKILSYMNEYGTSIRETDAIFNISSHATLLKWEKQFQERGIDALKSTKKGRLQMKKDGKKKADQETQTEESMESLQEEINRLRMENAYLKKLNTLVQNKERLLNKTKRK